jgi:citrate lyase subunit beta/citryl-CoA lyase
MRSAIARSYLFVPGNRPERFAKACAAGADAVIIDLEDAVAPADKDVARSAVAAWLSAEQPVVLRINSADTQWFSDDLALCGLPGVAGVILPKAEHANQIRRVTAAAPDIAVLPLIETAQGFANAQSIAHTESVQRLIFGSIDFQLDMRIEGDDLELLYFRSQLVLFSRVANIQAPVDGVTTAIDDVAQIQIEAQRARRLGFRGKLCIHPKQVDVVNRCFMPSAENIAWAQKVLAAAESAHGAAVAVDGKMIDLPVIRKAQEIVEEAAQGSGSM